MPEDDKAAETPATDAPADTHHDSPEKTAAPTGVGNPASAGGMNGQMPAELHGWNWGAFFFTWIWGLAHGVYWPLVMLVLAIIPFINAISFLVIAIYLGMNGNRLAWEKRKFASVEQFRATEKVWAIVGLVFFILGIIAFFFMMSSLAAVISGMDLTVSPSPEVTATP